MASSFQELPLADIFEIRREELIRKGASLFGDTAPARQMEGAWEEEQDDLRRSFWENRNTVYLFAGQGGTWGAMCRLESIEGSLLLSSLETAPSLRRRGLARDLIGHSQTIAAQHDQPLLSHVAKRNRPSLSLHRGCGFQEFLDYARLLDGSTSQNYITFRWIPESSEF